VPYTRVSTLAKALDDLNNLMAWKQRKTAEGLVRRPDLLTRVAGALANGDPDTDWPTKRALNDICREATEAAGASKGASSGTGFHALTEAIDRGDEPLFVPAADRGAARRLPRSDRGLHRPRHRVFVVNDELRAPAPSTGSGSAPTGCGVGDLKTGKSEADYPLATVYADRRLRQRLRYDPDDASGPLHADLDLTTGLLIHIPADRRLRQVIPLDLEKGWRAAQLAAEVHHDPQVEARRPDPEASA
jgi:hypothetical protein